MVAKLLKTCQYFIFSQLSFGLMIIIMSSYSCIQFRDHQDTGPSDYLDIDNWITIRNPNIPHTQAGW